MKSLFLFGIIFAASPAFACTGYSLGQQVLVDPQHGNENEMQTGKIVALNKSSAIIQTSPAKKTAETIWVGAHKVSKADGSNDLRIGDDVKIKWSSGAFTMVKVASIAMTEWGTIIYIGYKNQTTHSQTLIESNCRELKKLVTSGTL